MMTELLSNLVGLDISTGAWMIIMLAGVVVGLSKTAIPGSGILVVVLMAMALPSRMSVGVMLPMLVFGDLFAVGKYWPHTDRRRLLILLPFALAGLGGGYLILRYATNEQLKPIIGIVVLSMLALQQISRYVQKRRKSPAANHPVSIATTATFGILAGMCTGMANSAGPVMSLYLLIAGLPKLRFIATTGWFFFIMNLLKVPLFVSLDLITAQSLRINLLTLPSIVIGALLGFWLMRRISQERFNQIVVTLAFVAALKLLIG